MRQAIRIAIVGATVLYGMLAGHSAAADLTWKPRWTPGSYWVVRAPMMQPQLDGQGNETGQTRIGFYYTRFRVVSVDESAGGRTARLEIRWKENDAFTYEDNPEYVELDVNLMNLSVLHMTQYGIDARGQEFARPWMPDRQYLGKIPFCWLWDDGVLPGATASLPLAELSANTGGYLLNTVVKTTAWPFEQTVEVQPEAAIVTIKIDSCTSERMRFRADAPWHDTVDQSGTVIQEVIEVGQQ